MIPNFKKESYYEGINEATEQIIEFLNNPEALAEFKLEIEENNQKNNILGYGLLGLFLLIFVVVGGFTFFKSYRNIIEVFRGIFMGKFGVLPSVFMLIAGSLSTVFGLVFIGAPMVFV